MKRNLNTATLLTAMAASTFGGAAQPHALIPVPIQQVTIKDDFWAPKLRVWKDVTIPDCFAKFENDGALTNFDRIRDGIGGQHAGPPMFLKIMGALPSYIYAQRSDAIYVNLFIGSQANLTVKGTKVVLQQTTRYPWDGSIKLEWRVE